MGDWPKCPLFFCPLSHLTGNINSFSYTFDVSSHCLTGPLTGQDGRTKMELKPVNFTMLGLNPSGISNSF